MNFCHLFLMQEKWKTAVKGMLVALFLAVCSNPCQEFVATEECNNAKTHQVLKSLEHVQLQPKHPKQSKNG